MSTFLTRVEDGRPDYEQPDFVARTGARTLVYRVLKAQHGESATHQQPLSPSPEYTTSVEMPTDPLAGIAAARLVRAKVRVLIDDYALQARGSGVSWSDLAPAMGFVRGEAGHPEEEAFESLAGHDAVYWRCTACEEFVTDRGPYNPHPVDRETGHAVSCQRHRDEIAAYER